MQLSNGIGMKFRRALFALENHESRDAVVREYGQRPCTITRCRNRDLPVRNFNARGFNSEARRCVDKPDWRGVCEHRGEPTKNYDEEPAHGYGESGRFASTRKKRVGDVVSVKERVVVVP